MVINNNSNNLHSFALRTLTKQLRGLLQLFAIKSQMFEKKMPKHVSACFSINTQGKTVIKKEMLGYHPLCPSHIWLIPNGLEFPGHSCHLSHQVPLPSLTQLSTHSADNLQWTEILSDP